jgi:uncharacterized protein
MQFDRYTVALLIHRPDGPQLQESEAAALQDAHMHFLADLHEAGHLLAAGPVADAEIRGFSILNIETRRTQELKDQDPAVRAGVYSVRVVEWTVPSGAMSFAPSRFPRSMSEAFG